MAVKMEDNSDKVKKEMDEAVLRALEAIGGQAEGHAKGYCPVDTGRLRNSLTHAVSGKEDCVYVGSNVEYAPYVELGTQRTEPKPYLKPAVEKHKDEYKKIAQKFLSNAT